MGIAYSDFITLVNAGSKVIHKDHGGKVRVAKATIAAGTGDLDADDVIHMVQIPMHASILSIKVFNDDLDSNGTPALTVDCGLYYGGDNGPSISAGTVIDFDCYATDSTCLQAANTTGTELAFEARNITAVGNEVWEDGGLSSNPGGSAYVSLTIGTVAATQAAGDITVIVTYVV